LSTAGLYSAAHRQILITKLVSYELRRALFFELVCYNDCREVKFMADNKLLFLKTAFPEYKLQFSDDCTEAVIFNPFYDENIIVYYEADDDYTPFIVMFSFQHRHLEDKEEVIEWINDIITGRKFAIEFFKSDQRRFGSEIESKDLIGLSYEKLEQIWGYTKLLDRSDMFKVRAWDKQHNFDAAFICDSSGRVSIKKL